MVASSLCIFSATPLFGQEPVDCWAGEVIEITKGLARKLIWELWWTSMSWFCHIQIDTEHHIPNQNTNLIAVWTCKRDILATDGRNGGVLTDTILWVFPSTRVNYIYDPSIWLLWRAICPNNRIPYFISIPLEEKGITIPPHIDPDTVG